MSRAAVRAAVGAAAVLLAGLAGAESDAPSAVRTCGWPDPTQNAILDKARELMPPSLARQLKKHQRSLHAGVRQARAQAPHLQQPLQEAGTAALLADSLARVTALLDAQRPMSDVVREMGVAAHLVGDLSNPFLGAPDGADGVEFEERFAEYVRQRRDRFRVVFEGYAHPLLDEGRYQPFGMSLADRSRGYLDGVIGAFRRYDAGEDAKALDDRSIAFGVASLTYSRSVTDTARVWLHAWRQANGDLTGLPYPIEE